MHPFMIGTLLAGFPALYLGVIFNDPCLVRGSIVPSLLVIAYLLGQLQVELTGTKSPRRNGQGPRRSAAGELANQSPYDCPQQLGRR